MKVQVAPGDDGGCGHYRLIWPAMAADHEDLDVVVDDMSLAVKSRSLTWDSTGRRPITAIELPECDVYVCQRPLNADLVDALALMQEAGIAVVVDIDDAFHTISPRNSAYGAAHPHRVEENFLHLARACKAADLVTVTTPALAAKYGAHGRVAILPNMIPAALLTVDVDRPDPLQLGWSGTIATHPDDLKVVRGAIADVLPEGAHFAVVGDGVRVARDLALTEQQVMSTGWVPFEDYHRLVVETIGIGIVPLEDSLFNRCKSGLKALEYAALSIPNISSPIPDNVRLQQIGVTQTADKPKHWKAALGRLLSDPVLRDDMASMAHAGAATQTYEEHGWRWCEVWHAAGMAVRGVAA